MAFDHIVHHFAKDPDGDQWRITKVTPLVRLASGGESIYLQGGRILDAGGEVVKSPPAWFYEEVAKMTPRALAECGFKECPQRPQPPTLQGLGTTENKTLQAAIQQTLSAQQPPVRKNQGR